MKTNATSNIGQTAYTAPTKEARLDQVADSLEVQGQQVQSLNADELAEYRAYGANVSSDIGTVQSYGCDAQGCPTPSDPMAAIQRILDQLKTSLSYNMIQMLLMQLMLELMMMMEQQAQNGEEAGPGPVEEGPGPVEEDCPDIPDPDDQPKEQEPMTPVRAARILAQYFDLLDTAAGKGKKDNLVEMADLEAVAQNPDIPEELRRAAEYVVKNPMVAHALDVGNHTDEVDGRFGIKDFTRFIEEHEGKEGYDTPAPSQVTPKPPVGETEKKPPADETPVDEPTDETPKDEAPKDETPPVVAPEPKPPVTPNPNANDALEAQRDAISLYEGMRGFGRTDEALLIRTLSNRNNKQIAAIKDAYSKTYSRDLTEHVSSETSGHFKEVLLALLKGTRDESTKVDQNLVQDDAQAIYKAGGPAGLFTDDEKLVAIFTTRSKPHLAEVAKVFEHIHGQSLRSFVEKQTSGDYEDSLLAQLPA